MHKHVEKQRQTCSSASNKLPQTAQLRAQRLRLLKARALRRATVDNSPLEMRSKHPPWKTNLNQHQPH